MSGSKKIIIGVLTAIPALAIVLYIVFVFSFFLNVDDPGFNPEAIFDDIQLFAGIAIIFALLSFGLMIYYLLDILKYNKRFQVESNKKIVWLLIILFVGIFGMIVYYFMEILPRQEAEIPPAFPLDNEMMNEN